ncbi:MULTISPECIES: DNA repair protein RecN [unclassified Leptolyngbya]|uniref:DNA repair protein RecN n=1 Tax=unclassified Leptolyngbya TaxID=2650499 RepID=UPI001685621C|nr:MULTISPECIES: DNA repair protein RecN [unclassified Leptolyngbya]MBD1911010.1 DNA repair protein RecN [Leptolyngbya sp. FACHB-8]MBD2158323.1 DNA repair protein RecN [Leptolyngbya sp. FACHB-16]
MLISLQIEDFALIDRLSLSFGDGLNVLTGETGAGKSIILDALDAVLGGKVGSRAIRSGAERASIEATFRLDETLKNWLKAQAIEPSSEGHLICSREMTAGKGGQRSRSRVNGVVVNKQQLEELRDRLVEITAQGQTVQLGQPGLQRAWLDGFGGPALVEQREKVAAAHAAYQQAATALEKRRQIEQQRLQQLDLFEYQARDLAAANLGDPDELTDLEQERQRLAHAVDLKQQSYEVYQALYQNDSGGEACADLLGRAENTLTDMLRYDSQIQPILDMVIEAMAQVEEAGRQINSYGEDLETDPERLEEVEQRILQLRQICKKYGPTLADAIALHNQLQADLESLTDGGQSLETLEKQVEERLATLVSLCAALTDLRKAAAHKLQAQLVEELKPLAMDKVQFQVNVAPMTPSASGADRITFLFSPNPGEPLQPLSEIASGGEMSRFLLALKACFSQVDPIGTMVFDEIDTGVSGRVAQAIAEKLHQLGQRHQVLCVTHQPLIAAMATAHFRVGKHVIDLPTGTVQQNGSKTAKKGDSNGNGHNGKTEEVRTVVRVTPLDSAERKQEIAALVGGTDQEAIAFAESLLTQAAQTRGEVPEAVTAAKSTTRASKRRKSS